jgi:hypothetical protein
MKYETGPQPKWKGKPKASPLDTDTEFLKLRNDILSGRFAEFEERGLLIHEHADAKRLQAKNPARLVRDHLRRILKDARLEADYAITCRQTVNPDEWGVWVTHVPRESVYGAERVRKSMHDRRRTR